ncbi:hypothetical protein KUTeg_004697 [Tegillarca granosa]|uniref:Repulsive guidance molecule N-terminal domain-containing protein n=1 Tax=Tegillarca granosa TaxID=220873 RepID=A0ABQ9FHK0_TEGGR|nr:hypothetical protein KUTeg_004697 [Tegillarca granosa]
MHNTTPTMYTKILICLSVMVVMVSSDCNQDMNDKLKKCHNDYLASVAKVDQNDKSTFCGPLSTWQACMKPYADQCSDNLIFKMLAPIQDQLKSVCSGTVSVQFTLWTMAAIFVVNILFN